MQLDLDDIWPASASLTGMQFADVGDFDRCQAFLAEHPEIYRETDPESLFVAVRKSDAHLLDGAGLTYKVVELVDLDRLPSEQVTPIMRRLMREGIARLLAQPSRAP